MSFCYARVAPDPHGKRGSHFPWCQVVRHYEGGDESILIDFVRTAELAGELARQANLGRR